MFVLSRDKHRTGYRVECKLCGILSQELQQSVRNRQIKIVCATITDTPTPNISMADNEDIAKQTAEGTTKDETMGVASQGPNDNPDNGTTGGTQAPRAES